MGSGATARRVAWALAATVGCGLAAGARAQRAGENAVRSVEDAFGASIGAETIGLYSPDDVRGFSAVVAGNLRIDGLYFDQQEALTPHLSTEAVMRVGIAAQSFAFPAPTGVVDLQLRRPGDRAGLSVIAAGTDWGGYSLDVDAQAPLARTLSLGVGFGLHRDVFADRTAADYRQYTLIGVWRPRPGVEVTPFLDTSPVLANPATAIYLTAGGAPPVARLPIAYSGPGWDAYRGHDTNAGVVVDAALDARTSLRAGVFHSTGTSRTTFAELFEGLDAQGQADRVIIADPPLSYKSDSGEVRLAREISVTPIRQLLLVSLRGRDVHSRYGGSDAVDFGVGPIDPPPPIAEPAFAFGPQTHDHVRQGFAGLGWVMEWPQVLTASAGVQKTDYMKTVATLGRATVTSRDAPWLWNAALSVDLGRRLVAYASHTLGLEDAGQAPDIAVNRGALAPAIRTAQTDAGLRWKPRDGLSLVAGVFQVGKPYDAVDAHGLFRPLGRVENRGVELSLTGQPAPGWTLVAGAVLLDAAVSGEAVRDGSVGRAPVGSTPAKAQIDVEYAPPKASRWSFDVGANWRDGVVATLDDRYRLPPRATVDLGLRYRFRINRSPTVLRLQVTNIADTGGFVVLGPGAYKRAEERKAFASLATDF